MKSTTAITYYSVVEEKLNVRSHAVGVAFAVVAFVILMFRASAMGAVWYWVAYTIYGVSLITVFLASTLYHHSKTPAQRRKLKVFDHAAIYLSIAGTYTPFTLITLRDGLGWTIFGIVWSIAIIGIILKIFFIGRYQLLSTIGYVAMGWIMVFAIKPLISNLPFAGLMWLAAGGFLYTAGAIIYQIKRIPFNHAVFHFFVLGAAVCHFIAVYLYTN